MSQAIVRSRVTRIGVIAASLLAALALSGQSPAAADPVCAHVSYYLLGSPDDGVGQCIGTPFRTSPGFVEAGHKSFVYVHVDFTYPDP